MEFVAVWVFFKFSTPCFTFSCNLQGADTKDNSTVKNALKAAKRCDKVVAVADNQREAAF